jgi:hypothetical protein
MPRFSRRFAVSLLLVAVSLPLISCPQAQSNGKTGAGQLAGYLNPFQKKQKNLNQSQDRIIKKKSFKTGNMPAAQAVTNREIGFFVIVPSDKISDSEYVKTLLSNDKVNGLSATLPWSLLEPSEDSFNWAPLDQLLSACESQHKTLILRIATAGSGSQSETPKWVFDSGVKSISYTAADGTPHTMPIFWDKDYLAKWANFVTELSERYDKNPTLHSIGITGGGFSGGTAVLPPAAKAASGESGAKPADLQAVLKKDYGMTQRQLVEHWKYVADVFPKHFQNARLNFAINPPVPGRTGEDALDEIADYLVYRYGQRVYLTRQGVSSGKHGFDDYRLLLKFRNDTLTGLQLTDDVKGEDLAKIAKHALDDGVSFAELPAAIVESKDETVQSALTDLAAHIGYQLMSQNTTIPAKLGIGEPLKASFAFVNVGAAPALRPERNFDKDTPMSYRVLVELRDATGKPVLQNVHTPPTPTSHWEPGKPVTWDEELKMTDSNKHQLSPGEYTVWLSIIDPNGNRKLQFIQATSEGKTASTDTAEVGKLVITDSVADSKIDSGTHAAEGQH